MKKSVYLKLQLKRAFRHYPSVLLVTFVAIFGIVVTLGTLFFINNNSRDKQRINIGIVGNLHESRIDVVLYALENMDNLDQLRENFKLMFPKEHIEQISGLLNILLRKQP